MLWPPGGGTRWPKPACASACTSRQRGGIAIVPSKGIWPPIAARYAWMAWTLTERLVCGRSWSE